MLHILHFFPPQNAVYIMLSLLVYKVFAFCINAMLKFKCPDLLPKF